MPGNSFTNRSIGYTPKSWNSLSQTKLSFLETFNLRDITKMTKNLVMHNLCCPLVPTKLLYDISKFEGKTRDDPTTHILTFRLWCSSNSLMGDGIRLRIF